MLNQTNTQWQWLEAALKQGAAESSHVVLVSHHPPFLKSTDEAHVYWNWPLVIRKRLLGMLAKYGVNNVLCGHTHTTTSPSFPRSVRSGAGGARSMFDLALRHGRVFTLC